MALLRWSLTPPVPKPRSSPKFTGFCLITLNSVFVHVLDTLVRKPPCFCSAICLPRHFKFQVPTPMSRFHSNVSHVSPVTIYLLVTLKSLSIFLNLFFCLFGSVSYTAQRLYSYASLKRIPREWAKLCLIVKLPHCQYRDNSFLVGPSVCPC